MKRLVALVPVLTLLAAPAFAASDYASPSPNQRALQKPNSSDPATTVPDSTTEGTSSGEAGADVNPRDPALQQPDDAELKATNPDKPKK